MRVTLVNIPSKFTPTLRTQQYATALWMSYNCNSYCSMWNIMVMLIHFFDWGQKAARRALQVRERLMFLVKAAFAWFFLSTTVFTKAPFKPMHYGLKLTVSKFSNFPLLNPSQIAPKFYSLVEKCRAKNSTWVEADSI